MIDPNEPHLGKPRRQKRRAFPDGLPKKQRPTKQQAAETRERKAALRAAQWQHLPPSPKVRSLTLPWPPNVNHYWRHYRGHFTVSREGQQYRAEVVKKAATNQPLTGRLEVEILVCPPDRRTRDLDNLLKSILDSLTAAHVYLDDSQIDSLKIAKNKNAWDFGMVIVKVSEVTP